MLFINTKEASLNPIPPGVKGIAPAKELIKFAKKILFMLISNKKILLEIIKIVKCTVKKRIIDTAMPKKLIFYLDQKIVLKI